MCTVLGKPVLYLPVGADGSTVSRVSALHAVNNGSPEKGTPLFWILTMPPP